MKILHVAEYGPITKGFFSFLESNLECGGHELLTSQRMREWPELHVIKNVSTQNRFLWMMRLLRRLNTSDKIILHGLFNWYLIFALVINPWVLSRTYWIIWGGDLYANRASHRSHLHRALGILRRFVIKRFGNLVTYIEGDVELARKWYGAKGRYRECIMYLSNVFQDYPETQKSSDAINIQVGNSADPSNEHIEVFERLAAFRDKDILIHVPLAYGDREYAEVVVEAGQRFFGKKFIPMTTVMPLDEYRKYLGNIDIAIFNHKRQQAMGNTITLLGMGKKVYMRSGITSSRMLKGIGVRIFDTADIDLLPLSNSDMRSNREKISQHFSVEILLSQLKAIFEN